MTPQTVTRTTTPRFSEIVFPAAILQYPTAFFDEGPGCRGQLWRDRRSHQPRKPATSASDDRLEYDGGSRPDGLSGPQPRPRGVERKLTGWLIPSNTSALAPRQVPDHRERRTHHHGGQTSS
jgi:hypothetical protein